jgi:hypothetical protein
LSEPVCAVRGTFFVRICDHVAVIPFTFVNKTMSCTLDALMVYYVVAMGFVRSCLTAQSWGHQPGGCFAISC